MSDGGGLTLNVHFHTSVLDGVFTEDTSGIVRFHEAAAPTDEQVAALRRLVRRELDPAGDETSDPAVAE